MRPGQLELYWATVQSATSTVPAPASSITYTVLVEQGATPMLLSGVSPLSHIRPPAGEDAVPFPAGARVLIAGLWVGSAFKADIVMGERTASEECE